MPYAHDCPTSSNFRIEAESCCKCLSQNTTQNTISQTEVQPIVGSGAPLADGAFNDQLYYDKIGKTWYAWTQTNGTGAWA